MMTNIRLDDFMNTASISYGVLLILGALVAILYFKPTESPKKRKNR